ncbi:MAG: ABC transporter substrate-binding protein [Acidimicrobiales bacterium]
MVLGLLTACSSSNDSTGSTGASPSSSDEPDLEATLRWAAIGDGGGNYDPHTANNPGSTQYLTPAYDRLTYLDPDGKLQPMLATQWTTSAEGKALTFQLRPNVTFHDGGRFDAAAVKANIERGKTLDRSAVRPDLASIDTVDVVSDVEVRFNLSSPNAALAAILSDRPGMMISPAAFSNPDLGLKPVGAGPFKVVQIQPGSLLVFERYDGYWNKDAQRVKRIEMTMQLDSDTRMRSLTSGQADAMLLFSDQLDAVRKAGLVVGEAPTVPQVQMLFLNKTRAGLDKPEVRSAISHAIDREGISAALFDGKCRPTSQPFSSDGPYADPQTKVDTYDPNLSKQLLARAGVPNGFEFEAVMANVSWLVAEAEAVQAQLAKVGIRFKLSPLEPAQVIGRFVTEKSADAWFSALQSQVDPAKTVNHAMLAASVYNPGGFQNATIAGLAPQGVATVDATARNRVYQQISTAFAGDTFNLAICSLPTFFGSAQKVHGLRPNLTNTFDLREVWIGKGK